jgi:hypothetical protein
MSGSVFWQNNTDPTYVTFVMLESLSMIEREPQFAQYDSVTPTAHLLFTDSTGRHLGFHNGEFISEIPDAYKVVFYDDQEGNHPETYHTSNLDLKREIIGVADGIATASISRTNSLVIADVQVTPNSVDELHVPVDGSSVEFISGHGTSSLGLTLDRETAAVARVAHVDGFEVESGSKVQLRFSEDHNVLILLTMEKSIITCISNR